jgi:hypothetical protein
MNSEVSTSAGNVMRDTPGRLLLVWAFLFAFLVLLAWRIHVHRADYDWLEYPTALGDTGYYPLAKGRGLGADDCYEANLKFTLAGKDYALFRRLMEPTRRKDVRMRKVARDASDRFYVYTDEVAKADADRGVKLRFYLKAGEDAYIEFGEKVFFPSFEETRRQPPG